jgi:hypothetical protein
MAMARDRDRIATALAATEAQRKSREALVGQRKRDASTIADLKAERAALGAKGRQNSQKSHLVRSTY